jgi:hypothetical protein
MAKFGKCDYKLLKELQKKVDRLKGDDFNAFCESCAKELAARLLRKVIKRTPVGDYSYEVEVVAKRDSKKHKKGDVYTKKVSDKKGGTLRRGWTSKTESEARSGGKSDAEAYANSLPITKVGDTYQIEIINPVNYASYVEYGHRQTPGRYVPFLGKQLKKGWVTGKFMLTISEKELQAQAPNILEKKLIKYLGECFND